MLFLSIIFFIVSNSFTLRKDKSILYSRVSIINFIYIILLAYFSYFINFLSVGIALYGGLFFINSINKFFHIFICILTSIILIFNSFYPRKSVFDSNYLNLVPEKEHNFVKNNTYILDKTSEKYKILEYPLIILFIITGALFLTCSNDLISIFISIELQSYGVYLISSIYKNSESSTAGGLMYFLLGGLSSCLILLGISILYAQLGTTNLDNIYTFIKIDTISRLYDTFLFLIFIKTAILFMVVGFLFKISAAPFHFWSPDVYDAIPTVVTTFVAIIAKISILILLLELVHNSHDNHNYHVIDALLISSVLSLIIGSILGLNQQRIKRLYAYSTISHVGFILLALSIDTVESIQAFLFYLLQYSFSNLNAFILLISIGYVYYNYSDSVKLRPIIKNQDTSPIQYIDQLKGYFFINPILSISLSITLFSFAGIPPLIGFFGKMTVLSSAISNGQIFLSLIAILTSVISASYYLFIIKKMFFDKSEINKSEKDYKLLKKYENITGDYNIILSTNIVLSNYISISISIFTLIILLFMFIPTELLSMTCIFSMLFFNV